MPHSDWTDPERWEWLAAGEHDVAPKVIRSSQNENTPRQLLFETGLILLVPLALAALIEIMMGL